MTRHAMHCLLSDDKIPLWRRIRGRWYSSEEHYLADQERRIANFDTFRSELNPMRCTASRWGRPIGLLRRILGWGYCSSQCWRRGPYNGVDDRSECRKNERALRLKWREFDMEISLFLAVSIFVLCAIAVIAVQASADTPQSVAGLRGWLSSLWSVDHKAEYRFSSGLDLNRWTGPGVKGAQWVLQSGYAKIEGAVLYRGAQARKGSVALTISLAEQGSASFLMGCDSEAKGCVQVKLNSRPESLILTARRDGDPAPLDGRLQVSRNGNNRHKLTIEFTESRITADVNDHPTTWSQVAVKPGWVGLQSARQDDFRLYSAAIVLTPEHRGTPHLSAFLLTPSVTR